MKYGHFIGFLVLALFLAMAPTTVASSTWYVDGVNGSDSNNCMSSETACKTIGRAISLASSGESIMVAAATYTENLTISFSLNVIGSGAGTTIIDGGRVGRVVTIPHSNVQVNLANVTIRNGLGRANGGGIYNSGTLTIIDSVVSGNEVVPPNCGLISCGVSGGGISNVGTLTVNNSTVIGNTAYESGSRAFAFGGGISNTNGGMVTINGSTVSQNSVRIKFLSSQADGGGIYNGGTVTISNSTITGNTASGFSAFRSGGIGNQGNLTVNNSTVSGNSGGIESLSGSTTLQNSIVANNSGGNCHGTMSSSGYNLSSDGSCNLSHTGDLNNTDPLLGTLGNYGGPTQTIPLLSGSPAIDGGNPSGCTDGQGNLLKTDQRGMPRPDHEDTGGCDIGAYENQTD